MIGSDKQKKKHFNATKLLDCFKIILHLKKNNTRFNFMGVIILIAH